MKCSNIYVFFRWWCLSLELKCLLIQPLTRNATGVQSLRRSVVTCSPAVRAWHSYGDGHADPTAALFCRDVSSDEVTSLSESLGYHKLLLLNQECSDPEAQASCRKQPYLLDTEVSLLKLLHSSACLAEAHPLVPGQGTAVCANPLLPESVLYLPWRRNPGYAKTCLTQGVC